MGISLNTATLLLGENKARPFKGNVLTLGVQGIHFSAQSLTDLAARFGVTLDTSRPFRLSRWQELASKNYIDDITFLYSLGFSEVARMDYSKFEGAEITFDLNHDGCLPELTEKFDVIIDGGLGLIIPSPSEAVGRYYAREAEFEKRRALSRREAARRPGRKGQPRRCG